ncbi:MAG: peptidoglycan DD-metalloendopeptidase family protein [Nocardioidaceae bacterium]
MVLSRVLVAVVVMLGASLPPVVPGAAQATTPVVVEPAGQWPLVPEPRVVRAFDPPEVVWGVGHRGVDLLGSPGEAVHAALAGRVSFGAILAGRGVVVVDHGDTRTTYQPVTATLPVGTPVAAGDVIGTLQVGGSHCPPAACLHWGWRRGDRYLDPLLLVGLGPVRLLPLWGPSAGGQARGCACW